MIIGCAVEQAFLNSLSTLPQIKPINSGTSVAIKLIKGIEANPVAPSATKVKKCPSLSDRIEIAPVSVAFPNCDDNEIYREPFEFVMAAINTNGVIPRKPASPKFSLQKDQMQRLIKTLYRSRLCLCIEAFQLV